MSRDVDATFHRCSGAKRIRASRRSGSPDLSCPKVFCLFSVVLRPSLIAILGEVNYGIADKNTSAVMTVRSVPFHSAALALL